MDGWDIFLVAFVAAAALVTAIAVIATDLPRGLQPTSVSEIAGANVTAASTSNATRAAVPPALGQSFSSNFIYCVGDSGYGAENLSFYAPISGSGIGNWTQTTSYPVGVDDAGCAIYKGRIYCVGTNATDGYDVNYANISGAGIGEWAATTSYPVPGWYTGCSIYGGYIYCIGDRWLGQYVTATHNLSVTDRAYGPGEKLAYYAQITANGVGNWTQTTSYPIPLYTTGCAIYEGYVYCVGAYNASYQNRTYYAQVSASGIGKWTQTTSYPRPFTFGGCQIYEGRIYCEGGDSNLTYYANVSGSGIGNWIGGTSLPVKMLYEGGCTIQSGYAYCVGNRWGGAAGHQVFFANVLADGGFGAWMPSTPFPIPLYGDSWCVTPGSGGGFLSGGGELPVQER